ncbi:AEC family transporter, partial [Faecalibacterium prausnitzii]|nr:AEC family transporter [Faecalibacterium prausnitzii]
ALITQPLELLAGVNTPLSLLITGMLIAAGDVRSIVPAKHIWKLACVRMLLIPAATQARFGELGFHGTAAPV